MLSAILLVILAGTAVAQDRQPVPPPNGGLEAAHYDANTHVQAPVTDAAKRQQTARIFVDYRGNFPQGARGAFERAASIWEAHIESDVDIWIRATWTSLAENTLGSAGTTYIFANDVYLPRQGAWYNMALAEAAAGRSLISPANCAEHLQVNNGRNCAAIVAQFNSDFDWSFEEGPVPGRHDFMTVVLHEIGHGLGFFDSFSYDDGVVEDDNPDECPGVGAGYGCWGQVPSTGGDALPYVFDLFLEDHNGVSLLNTGVYPNPSRALGNVLQSDAVFLSAEGVLGANEVPASIYAPSAYNPGSSIAHLDELTFPPGNPNALMTPQLARAEVYETPGPITCGLFQDMGWQLGPACLEQVNLLLLAAARSDDGIEINFSVNERLAGRAARLVVDRREYDGDFVTIDSLAFEPGETQALDFSNLPPARYTFRLRVLDDAGTTILSQEVHVLLPELLVVESRRTGEAARVSVDVSDGPDGAEIVLEQQFFGDGFVEVARRDAEIGETVVFDVPDLRPGTHSFRARLVGPTGETIHVVDGDDIQIPFSGQVLVEGPFPNPVTTRATVNVLVRRSQTINAELYDALGRNVETVASGYRIISDERATFTISAAGLSAGVYFLRVWGNDFDETTSMVVVR